MKEGTKSVTAILQARMSSTRLPGKVLMKVMGRPLLSYLVERLRFCKSIDQLILATSSNHTDDPIADFGTQAGIDVFRGAEHDVLDRYYCAAKQFNAEHIMRITGDCPLIQPDICDDLAIAYFQKQVDYIHTDSNYAEGLDCEIFSFEVLKKAWLKASKKSEREHVTLYLHNNSEEFQLETLANVTDDSRYRFVVDEKEDFMVVKKILENLYHKKNNYITIDDIKKFLDSCPEIFNLNAHIVRNEGLLISLRKDLANEE